MSAATEESVAPTHKDESVILAHKDNLTANIFGTGDLVIELKYCKWAVHQKKFENASDFFKRALESDRWKEGYEHYIKLHDDSPIMFARCIQFLYSGTYDYTAVPGWFGKDTTTAQVHKLSQLLHGQPLYNTPGSENSDIAERMLELYLRGRLVDWAAVADAEHIGAATTTDKQKVETEKRADVKYDSRKLKAQIDLAMYQLADKYGMSSLQEYALYKFKCNVQTCIHDDIIYRTMFNAVNAEYPDLDLMDSKLKESVSLAIASNYEEIDTHTDDEAAGVREWLESDHELCHMVMKRLGRRETLKDDPGYREPCPVNCRCRLEWYYNYRAFTNTAS